MLAISGKVSLSLLGSGSRMERPFGSLLPRERPQRGWIPCHPTTDDEVLCVPMPTSGSLQFLLLRGSPLLVLSPVYGAVGGGRPPCPWHRCANPKSGCNSLSMCPCLQVFEVAHGCTCLPIGMLISLISTGSLFLCRLCKKNKKFRSLHQVHRGTYTVMVALMCLLASGISTVLKVLLYMGQSIWLTSL